MFKNSSFVFLFFNLNTGMLMSLDKRIEQSIFSFLSGVFYREECPSFSLLMKDAS